MSTEPDVDVAAAELVQSRLRDQLDPTNHVHGVPELVVGLDVSYPDDDASDAVAAAVVLDVAGRQVREVALAAGRVTFPYLPGLLAFREVPLLLEALDRLTLRPQVLVCDGYGIAHPRRFGLASHLGVVTGIPAFGVAKTPFRAMFDEPGLRRGDWSPLYEGGEVLGRALRTQDGVKPVFVSIGNRIGLDEATDLTLRLCGRYRLPESTRQADQLSRAALRRATGADRGHASGHVRGDMGRSESARFTP